MRKFLVIAIPVITLIFFVLIMQSGCFLKYSWGDNDNIPQSIGTIMQDVKNENWESADENTSKLEDVWKRIVRRVQFSSERNEINEFSTSVARLRGAIQAKDKSNALSELNEAYEHWDELSN
ncbi:MAG: DUF4363 family protein [Desulfitobacteriaceae bacterium]|nr:DUF4363 family protein [Desulfitobacteriaceae bacterium]